LYGAFVNAGSEVLLDSNLSLILHDNLGDHPSRHEYSGSTSFDDGYYEERLDDRGGSHNSAYFDDPNASSSRVSLDLVEKPRSLLIFLRDRRRAVMKGASGSFSYWG